MDISAQWAVNRLKRWKGTDTTRFWEKVSSNGNGCWEWLGAKTPLGYGLCWFGKKLQPAHRVCYEMAFGPIANGLVLDHLCRNPSCVNPYHLDAVTHRTNTLRGISFAASKARQTHCVHGHEFTPENTKIKPNGTRQCRACKKYA